jgi:hypothetical protein
MNSTDVAFVAGGRVVPRGLSALELEFDGALFGVVALANGAVLGIGGAGNVMIGGVSVAVLLGIVGFGRASTA